MTESWKFLLNFSTFSIGGCWGQSMLLFWKLVDKTQISKPQDHTDNFKHNPKSIFLSVRPKLLLTFQYEIPCSLTHKLPFHSIKNHIYENPIKFEVSLHFWRIWPSVWRLNGNCCENSKVHNNFLKKTTLRHVSGFLLHPLNSKIPKSSIFLTIGIPSGSSKGIQKPSIFPIRILMSSPLLYCIVIKA